jgi:hypothetical protein
MPDNENEPAVKKYFSASLYSESAPVWEHIYGGVHHGYTGPGTSGWSRDEFEPDPMFLWGADISRGLAVFETAFLNDIEIISLKLRVSTTESLIEIVDHDGNQSIGNATLVITDASSATDYDSLKDCPELFRMVVTTGTTIEFDLPLEYINLTGNTKFGVRVGSEYDGASLRSGDNIRGEEKVKVSLQIIYTDAIITTEDATQITSSSAFLNGSQTDCTTVFFEYGRTTDNLNNSTSPMSATDTFYRRVDGLLPLQNHYFRAVGEVGNSVVYGDILEFTTLAPSTPLTPPTTTHTPGYQWVEGTDYHYIDSSGVERQTTGTLTGTTGIKAGFIWKEDETFHYIDQTGAERQVDMANYQPDGFEYSFEFFFDGSI